MKVSFHCFLIVGIFSRLTLGGDNLNCSNVIERAEICCDGRVYNIAETIWPEESCDVEPKNATMTFADSAWLAYHCNVRKRLDSIDLTMESYFNLLVRVRNSSQRSFWETLTSPRNTSKITVDEDEYDKIQTIKLYQREYLHAVEQACTFEDAISTSGNTSFDSTSMNFKTRFPGMKYAERCNEEMLPYSAYFAGNSFNETTYKNYKKCQHVFNQTLGNTFYSKFRASTNVLCRAIASKHLDIQTQIRKSTLDFEFIVKSLSPAFWSQSAKNSVKDWIFEELKLEFQAQDLENVESLMRRKFEERINHELSEGESITNKREVVQAVMIFHISDIFETTATNVCGFDASRIVHSGV